VRKDSAVTSATLADRVIAIAGVGGGLGPLVAARLAEAGAMVAGTGRNQEVLDSLPGEMGIPAERWDGRAVDLLDEAAAREWCAALVERFGHVDGLIHLVGGWRGGTPLHEAPLSDWDLLHDLLIRTVQHTSRAFSAPLRASGSGRFALVSSKQAQAPTHDNAAYAAAKAAAEAWTLALGDELAADGGAANILVVNAIVTPEMRAADPDKAFKSFTDAADIAAAIAFMFGDATTKMNGKRLSLHP
jgi:NAD(P)-dependent dehydrogenase (short-subunit alcohol dehydrogenase family)